MEQRTTQPRRRIDLSKERYDQSSFWGRLQHFVEVTDSRTLLTTQAQLDDALRVLKEYQSGKDIDEERVWDAKRIKEAILHPQTNEKVPLPFRMSAFAPVNIFICAGMLLPTNPSMLTTAFWQWFNQSYNIGMNYANRNTSNALSNEQIASAYGSAVAISCSLAVGLNEWAKRLTNVSPTTKALLQKCVPFTAVSAAGVANVFIMRNNEMREGIEVMDENGEIVEGGKSPKAGFRALVQTSISRLVPAFVSLIFPPAIMTQLEKISFVRNSAIVSKSLNLGVITAMLFTALPVAVALFPRVSEVPVTSLEERYHGLKDKNGKPITKLYYNKGL